MKRLYASLICVAAACSAFAQYASSSFLPSKPSDSSVFFSTIAQGKKLPILWGLDTAWPDEWNMVRGVRFIGAENIGVARVSFQPWDWMLSSTNLTARLESNLKDRLRLVSLIGGPDKVQLVLNNDGPLEECDERYQNAAKSADACKAYCNLIYGTMLSCQDKGWTVITASPLNEPDYIWNGQGSMDDFLAIAKMLKTDYDQFKDGKVRISGGNTLNCDQAEPWYTYLYDYIDEGNTHQLAGDFDHYADFFAKVRADGKYATADELHNVMEAMVGVEYGMQTGIWWGTAERTRGEFCKASFGERLAYTENRKAWTSAAVYRAPDGQIQGFVGSSERQAQACTYRFVSQDRDVFFNGYGPQREFVVDIPGGKGYQDGQTNAECMVDITWGEDVSPIIDGTYQIMNKKSKKLLAIKGAPGNSTPVQQLSTAMASMKTWIITPTPITIGGDFSYFTIKLADKDNFKLDVNNWSLNEGGDMIIYDGGTGANEQWYFKYAGDGYFRIFSRHSNLCLQAADEKDSDGATIVQATPSDSPSQLWRLIDPKVMCETVAPMAPTDLAATPQSASIKLTWSESESADVAQYVVLRAEEGSGDYNTIARYFKASEFVDNTVVPGKKYSYKVKAIDKAYNSSDCSSAVSASSLPGNTLIARYLFNRELSDCTENHFDAATYVDARVVYGSGRESDSKALNLSTGRFVQLPYQVANYHDLSVGMWINTPVKANQTIFDFGADTEHFVKLYVNDSGELALTVRNGDDLETISGGVIAVNEWQHVAATISKKRAAVFIDGNLVASASLGLGCDVAEISPILNYIGCSQELNSYINARIQDLCIYSGIIPDANIPSMMEGVVGIADTMAEAQIVATEYYNMLGMRVDKPTHGVYIVKRVYDNGNVISTKETVR